MTRIDEIRARRAAATPGPWEYTMSSPSMSGENWTLRTTGKAGIRLVVSEYQHGLGNADFIANAPDDIDYLLAVIERVRELHHRRPWMPGDFVYFGQTEFPDQCGPCRLPWPCATIRALDGD